MKELAVKVRVTHAAAVDDVVNASLIDWSIDGFSVCTGCPILADVVHAAAVAPSRL